MFKDTIFQFCAYEKRFDERIVCNGLEGERVAFREGHLSISRVRGKIRVRESGRAILRFRACEERFGGIASKGAAIGAQRRLGRNGKRENDEERKRKKRGKDARKGKGAGDDARTSCASFLRASALKREANSSLGKF